MTTKIRLVIELTIVIDEDYDVRENCFKNHLEQGSSTDLSYIKVTVIN